MPSMNTTAGKVEQMANYFYYWGGASISRGAVAAAPASSPSWEEQAFARDAAGHLVWPPRSYTCTVCRREFRSAQALGGHMNVHRRDRARLRQCAADDQPQQQPPISPISSCPRPRPRPPKDDEQQRVITISSTCPPNDDSYINNMLSTIIIKESKNKREAAERDEVAERRKRRRVVDQPPAAFLVRPCERAADGDARVLITSPSSGSAASSIHLNVDPQDQVDLELRLGPKVASANESIL